LLQRHANFGVRTRQNVNRIQNLLCGLLSGKVVDVILPFMQLAMVESSPEGEPFNGDPQLLRLTVEAMCLALAFEYDPYISLFIVRVDPLEIHLRKSRCGQPWFSNEKIAKILAMPASRFVCIYHLLIASGLNLG